jgi:putrescine aminotransferase
MQSPEVSMPLSVQDAAGLPAEAYLSLYAKHVNHLVVESIKPLRLSRTYVAAKGIYLWDEKGDKYYDFFSGFGCLNLGHNHPKIVAAVRRAIDLEWPMIHQLVPSRFEAALAASLTSLLPETLQVCYFQSSGSEAIDTSIKIARGATRRQHLLSVNNAYHGMTIGALSLTGIEQYGRPFEPLMPLVERVPFGDAAAAEKELATQKYAALFLEPILGQGGVIVAPDGYLERVRAACDRFGTLLVFDEVQTGMGRTGKMFAFEHHGVTPDVLILSKSLGGGVMPLSAYVTSKAIWNRVFGSLRTFQLHESTFSGNTLACVTGLAAITTLLEEDLCANSAAQGAYFQAGLTRVMERNKIVAEVRGRGLMIGVRLDLETGNFLSGVSKQILGPLASKMVTAHVASRLLNEFNVIVAPSLTDDCVLRLFPPLNVTSDEIDYFLNAFNAVCSSLGTYSQVFRTMAPHYVRQFMADTVNRRRRVSFEAT